MHEAAYKWLVCYALLIFSLLSLRFPGKDRVGDVWCECLAATVAEHLWPCSMHPFWVEMRVWIDMAIWNEMGIRIETRVWIEMADTALGLPADLARNHEYWALHSIATTSHVKWVVE